MERSRAIVMAEAIQKKLQSELEKYQQLQKGVPFNANLKAVLASLSALSCACALGMDVLYLNFHYFSISIPFAMHAIYLYRILSCAWPPVLSCQK